MIDEEDRPKRPVTHIVGEKLDDLSISELDERIELLRTEIQRLEVGKRLKQAAKDVAGSVFRT